MRHRLTLLMAAALWGGLAVLGPAEEPKPAPAPDQAQAASRAAVTAEAAVRAEIHRTLADLIEARAAEKPDAAQIDKLTQKLQDLRGKLRAQQVAAGDLTGSGRPWGGPGMGRGAGRGPGAGGGGRGFGPGAGQGLAPGGPAYVDRNNNGICDYYELRQGK